MERRRKATSGRAVEANPGRPRGARGVAWLGLAWSRHLARPWLALAGACAVAALLLWSCSTPTVTTRTVPGEVDEEAARAASRAGDWALAASRWNTLFLHGGADSVTACRETVRALLELGDLAGAKGVVDLGLQRHPGHPELLEAQGNVLAGMGFRRAAEASFQQALEQEPGRASAWLALARVRLELGMASGARTALEQRMQVADPCPLTWLLYGHALKACGKSREAVDAYERAFAAGAPADLRCLLTAAGACLSDGVRKDPRARELARDWLERAVQLAPQSTLAHHYLGLIAEEDGRAADAIAHYTRAAETDPAHVASLGRLAELFQRGGELERSAEMARRALDLERDPGRRQALSAFLLEPTAKQQP